MYWAAAEADTIRSLMEGQLVADVRYAEFLRFACPSPLGRTETSAMRGIRYPLQNLG